MKLSITHSKYRNLATSILLFLIVFGVWQVFDLIIAFYPLPPLPIPVDPYSLSNLILYGVSIVAFLLFVELGKSRLKEQGFKEPSNTRKTVILSICFALVYIAVTLAPGFLFGFTTRSYPDLNSIIFNITRAILIALTTESIFRGYIFRNLTKNHGFFISLYISSILFGLYGYASPISILDLLNMSSDEIIREVLFQQVMPVFTSGLFLGFMFYKMDWSILGPFIFRVGTLLYFFLSPMVASSAWWMGLTFEVMAYACLFIIADSAIKEPRYRRRRYRLE